MYWRNYKINQSLREKTMKGNSLTVTANFMMHKKYFPLFVLVVNKSVVSDRLDYILKTEKRENFIFYALNMFALHKCFQKT